MDFMHRSAISVISLSTDTGRSTRTSSPRASSAPRKSRTLSSAIMDGADSASQDLVAYVRESGVLEPAREGVRVRKVEHGLWPVRIGVPMFRHRTADRGEDAPEIEQVERAHRREARCGEFEHHETRARPEHAMRFPEAGVEIRQVPDPEGHHRSVEPGVGEGGRDRVGADRTAACAGCAGGGGVIGAKDRPANLAGASDAEVVAWAKQGQEAAFRELVRRYERPIFSLLYRMVRDRALAEDLAQETFIKVLNAIGTYNPQFKFSSWIFKIANNAAIDHLRRRELETLSLDGSPHATTPDEMSATAPQLGDRGETPLQELEARELGGAIEHAIARLRPEYRTCILLRHVEGHSYEEIARILDLPLGTVKTYIHRARNELRGYLEDRRE